MYTSKPSIFDLNFHRPIAFRPSAPIQSIEEFSFKKKSHKFPIRRDSFKSPVKKEKKRKTL